MIKRKVLSFVCTILIASITLIACSSKQSTHSQSDISGQSKQSAEEVKPVGFIGLANENTERIWFVADEIAKDEEISGLYVVKNSKATYYHLLTYTANSDVENGPRTSDEHLTFSDIKNLSNKEIIEKAKKLDREAYDSYFQSFLDIADKALQEWASDGENKLYVPAIENIKSSLLDLQGESAYKNYRKRVSGQLLSASIKTDDTGNTVTDEEIKLPSFPKYTADYLDSNSLVLDSENKMLEIDASSFMIGDIYDSNYVSFGDSPLITRDLPKKTYPYLDSIDTKNIVEK